jgi:hypothetical protein
MLYRWLNESEESSRYWRQQAEKNSASDFSLMLTLCAVEEVHFQLMQWPQNHLVRKVTLSPPS